MLRVVSMVKDRQVGQVFYAGTGEGLTPMSCTVLYLHGTVLYCTVLYYTIQYSPYAVYSVLRPCSVAFPSFQPFISSSKVAIVPWPMTNEDPGSHCSLDRKETVLVRAQRVCRLFLLVQAKPSGRTSLFCLNTSPSTGQAFSSGHTRHFPYQYLWHIAGWPEQVSVPDTVFLSTDWNKSMAVQNTFHDSADSTVEYLHMLDKMYMYCYLRYSVL